MDQVIPSPPNNAVEQPAGSVQPGTSVTDQTGSMGNTGPGLRSGIDAEVLLRELAEQEGAEIDGPDPVGGLLEADVLVIQGPTQKELTPPEANGSGGADEPDEMVPGIVRFRERARIPPRRWLPQTRRRPLRQGLMWPLVVVRVAEGVELPLLASARE